MKRLSPQVRVAIVGVGNCASSLVQGLQYYSDTPDAPGLMNHELAGFTPSDISVVAAFDIDRRKVGQRLHHAIYAEPNCTFEIVPPDSEWTIASPDVLRGPTLDGIGPQLTEVVEEDDAHNPVDVVQVLRDAEAEVLVLYLPVGSQEAAEYYMECALEAGVAVVNCIPVFIASNPQWARRFEERGLPIIGDDIKAQVGATILHRELLHLFDKRGATVEDSYQLNSGGNTDFKNMLDKERTKSKHISKTQSVLSAMEHQEHSMESETIHAGPGGFIPHLKDKKVAFIEVTGQGYGGSPIRIEAKLEVWDSPGSGACVMDAIRICGAAKRVGIYGSQYSSAAYMKSPIKQFPDDETQYLVEQLVSDIEEHRQAQGQSESQQANSESISASREAGGASNWGQK